jgi:hypothetical protein
LPSLVASLNTPSSAPGGSSTALAAGVALAALALACSVVWALRRRWAPSKTHQHDADSEAGGEEDDEEESVCTLPPPTLGPSDDCTDDEEEEEEEEEDDEEVEEDEDEEDEEDEEVEDDNDEDGWEFVSDDEGSTSTAAASTAAEVGGKRKRVTFDSQPQEQSQPARAPAAPKDPKNRIDANRILSSEDFSLISRLRTAMAERAKDPRYRTKVKNLAKAASLKGSGGGSGSGGGEDADGDDETSQGDGLPYMLDDDALGAACRTSKSSKLERMTRVLEGRKETGNFEHNGHGGGTTNLEKLRKKNYVMVRKGKRSVRNKIRTSNSETRWNKMHQTEQYGRDRRKRRRT